MIKLVQNGGSQRRSFRLSPLETMILGLVAVGALYLVTMWVTSFFPSLPQAQSSAVSDQSGNALVAAERAQAQVNILNKELASLRQKLDALGGLSGKQNRGQAADPKLAARVDALLEKTNKLEAELVQAKKGLNSASASTAMENRLDRLEKNLQKIESKTPAPDPRLMARLEAVEKKPLPNSDKLTELEKKVSKLEIDQAQVKKGAEVAAAREDRLKSLEKELEKIQSSNAVSSPKLTARMETLEKKVNGQLAPLEEKVQSLEKNLARTKERPTLGAEGDRRLKQMEEQLKLIASQSKTGDGELMSRVESLEKGRAQPATQLESLQKKLKNLEEEVTRRKQDRSATSLTALELRFRRLEQELLLTRQSLRRVQAPVPDPEMVNRLEKLEKSLNAGTGAAGSSPQTDKRLQELAARVEALARSQKELGQQLAQREKPKPALTKVATARPAPPPKPEKVSSQPKPASASERTPTSQLETIRHKVRRGETIFGLARRYKVTMKDILAWNPKLNNRRHLWIGETLLIYQEKRR